MSSGPSAIAASGACRAVSGLYVVAQMAILSFVVLYLHDERGLGKGEAAAVLGAVQVVAVVLRVGAGPLVGQACERAPSRSRGSDWR